jgi:hypothetical protein
LQPDKPGIRTGFPPRHFAERQRRRLALADISEAVQRLIKDFGLRAVRGEIERIEQAGRRPKRSGRPRGPAVDDMPALQAVAEDWRANGKGKVWPSITKVADDLARTSPMSKSTSHAERLLSRLKPRTFADLERLHNAGLMDLHAAVAGEHALSAATVHQINLIEATYKIHDMLIRSISESSRFVSSAQIADDVTKLLEIVTACPEYEKHFNSIFSISEH